MSNARRKHEERSYLLTPWCRVLLEKLTGMQLVKKFPVFHGTRRFITALASFRPLSLSWASPIQSIYLHPTSWRSILILSTHLRLGLPSGLFPSGFPTNTIFYVFCIFIAASTHYALQQHEKTGLAKGEEMFSVRQEMKCRI